MCDASAGNWIVENFFQIDALEFWHARERTLLDLANLFEIRSMDHLVDITDNKNGKVARYN